MYKKRKLEFSKDDDQYLQIQECLEQNDTNCTQFDAEWTSGISMLLPINKLIFWNLPDMKVVKVGFVLKSFHSDRKEVKEIDDWIWHVEYGYDESRNEYELFKIYKCINNEFYTKIEIAINNLQRLKQK